MSDEQASELREQILSAVMSEGNWQNRHDSQPNRITDVLMSVVAHHTKEAVEEAKEATAKMYQKEIQYLRAFQDSVIQRDQLRLPETMYLCSDPKCSKLHTKAELAAPQQSTSPEGSAMPEPQQPKPLEEKKW